MDTDYSELLVAKTFRYFDYDKKPCRALVYSNHLKEGEEPGIQKRKVLVKHLSRTVTSKSLEDRFAMYGTILSSRVVLDENHKSLGYGFVVFEQVSSAEYARAFEFTSKKYSELSVPKTNEDIFYNSFESMSVKNLFQIFQKLGAANSIQVFQQNDKNNSYAIFHFQKAVKLSESTEKDGPV